ncbi:MAG: hypothetical protein ACYCW6_09635 [Candidatus Xenobia bacterium]
MGHGSAPVGGGGSTPVQTGASVPSSAPAGTTFGSAPAGGQASAETDQAPPGFELTTPHATHPAFTANRAPLPVPREPPRFIVQNGHLVPNPALAKR